MRNKKPTLGRLIKLAMEMEEKAYEFYDVLEQRFKDKNDLCACLCDIKEDEKAHLRVLKEIKKSLSDVRLSSLVPEETISKMEDARNFLDNLDIHSLKTSDELCNAIQRLESVEFDIVLVFVDINEIKFDFARAYLNSQSGEHMKRVYEAQQCLD